MAGYSRQLQATRGGLTAATNQRLRTAGQISAALPHRSASQRVEYFPSDVGLCTLGSSLKSENSKMRYTILCYHNEEITSSWTEEEDAEVIECLKAVNRKWAKNFEPIVRLMPTSAATTLRKTENIVTGRSLCRDQGTIARLLCRQCRQLRGGGSDRARNGGGQSGWRLRTAPHRTLLPERRGNRRCPNPLNRTGSRRGSSARGRRPSLRCCAISAISILPRKRFRRPVSGRSSPGRRTARRAMPRVG